MALRVACNQKVDSRRRCIHNTHFPVRQSLLSLPFWNFHLQIGEALLLGMCIGDPAHRGRLSLAEVDPASILRTLLSMNIALAEALHIFFISI